jgi:hypothetical protein
MESSSNGRRISLNPLMVEYKTYKQERLTMYRLVTTMSNVHYGQNLWWPTSTKG